MKSRSAFGTINRNNEELSYVQVNIYGTKLNDLRRKGVDVLKILKGLGVAECLMWEVPLPPACANRTSKLLGGNGSIAGCTRKSPRGRLRPPLSGGSTRSSSNRSDVNIKQENEEQVGAPDQRGVRRLLQDSAREGGEAVLQESELLMNCSISTIHSCGTKAPIEGPVRLTRRPTVNSDCTEKAYPPLLSIPTTASGVIPEDNNDANVGKVQNDVEMRTAVVLDDDTRQFDPDIDYLGTSPSPPLADDVIQVDGALDDVIIKGLDDVKTAATDDVIETGTIGTEEVAKSSEDVMTAVADEVVEKCWTDKNINVEDAELAGPTDRAFLKPCESAVEETPPCNVGPSIEAGENERSGADERIVPNGPPVGLEKRSTEPVLSENILGRTRGPNQMVGSNRPAEPSEEAVGSNVDNDCMEGEFFDCSLGSLSDVAGNASMVQSTSAAIIRPIPVRLTHACSISGFGCGTGGMMERKDGWRKSSLQEIHNHPKVTSCSPLSEAVSRRTFLFSPPFVSSDQPPSMSKGDSETGVPPQNPESQGSTNYVDSNRPDTLGCDQPPPIESAISILNHSNPQKVLESEESPAGFFYGGLYFDASFRSVVSHPSLIMEVESPTNQEADLSRNCDKLLPDNRNSCDENTAGQEVDNSLHHDHFIDQPVTDTSKTATIRNSSQPPVSQNPAASGSADLSIDRSGISTAPPTVSIEKSQLSIDRPRLSTPLPNLSIEQPEVSTDQKNFSIDGRDDMVVDSGGVSDPFDVDHNDSQMSHVQGTNSTSTRQLKDEEQGTSVCCSESGKRKRKNCQVSCESSSSKNPTPRTSKVSNSEQFLFQCMYPGCRSKIQWRSRYGKDRLLNHVRLHWPKQLKKCPCCDYTAAVGRTVRRHFEQEHVDVKWEGHVNLETKDDVSELLQFWKTCFPTAGTDSPGGDWPKEIKRFLELFPINTTGTP